MAIDVTELRAKNTILGIIRRIKLLNMYIMVKSMIKLYGGFRKSFHAT